MSTEPRKATDVLLDLESKLDSLLGLVRSQDLVIKVLSNKLNEVMNKLDKQQAAPPKIIVETIQSPHPQSANLPPGFKQMPAGESERTVPIVAEQNLPQTDAPQGFRRNSRPETYAKVAPAPLPEEIKMPMQLPNMGQAANSRQPQQGAPPPGRGPGSELANMMPAKQATNKGKAPFATASDNGDIPSFPAFGEQNQVPVTQRCVDKNGKSIFLASVSITNLEDKQSVYQGRTSGTGKWSAPLSIGSYRVVVSKQGSSIKDKMEAVQDVHVDGSKSPLELPMMIIK